MPLNLIIKNVPLTNLEKSFEGVMYASHWLLAPIYIGLSIGLLLLSIKFFQEVLHIFPDVLEIKETDLVLFILSMVDIALVGGLIVMVIYIKYETKTSNTVFFSSLPLCNAWPVSNFFGGIRGGA